MIRIFIDMLIILILGLYAASSVELMRAEKWFIAGEQAEKKNDLEKAMQYYQQAVDLVPESGRYWRNLAQAAMTASYREGPRKRMLYRAYNACQHVMANDPLYPYGWFDTGKVLWTLSAAGAENVPDPEPYFLRALEIDPNNPLFLEGMLRWLLDQGEVEEARLMFYRLANFNPDTINSLAPHFLKTEQQREEFGRMLGNPRAKVMYAMYLVRRGSRDLAAAQIKDLQPQALKRPDIAYFAGRVLISLNRRDEAKQIISVGFEQDPGYAYIAKMLATLYLHDREYDEAIEVYQMALKHNPRLWEFNISIAEAARKKGDLDLAIASYKKALDAGKAGKQKIKKIHVAIAEICRQKKDLKRALKHYKLALEQDPEDRDLQFEIKKVQVEMEMNKGGR